METDYKERWKRVFPNYDEKALYDNGLPFNTELLLNLEEVKKRTYDNPRHLPSIIVIDGASGLGKTTLAFLLGSYLQGSPLDMEHQRSIGITEFLQKALWVIKNKKKVIIYDEAGDFERKATNSKVSRDLNRFFELYRTFAIVPIIVLPSFLKLDSGLFINKIPRFLVHIYDGDDHQTYYKGYSLASMMKIRHYFYYNQRFLPILDEVYQKFTPTFAGAFKKPPEDVIKLVDYKSDEGKLAELERLFGENLSNDSSLDLPNNDLVVDEVVDPILEKTLRELEARKSRVVKERPDGWDLRKDIRFF